MVRKRRTEGPGAGESSESHQAIGGRGVPGPQTQGGRGGGAQRPPGPQPHQGGGYGRGYDPQSHQGGRGGYGGRSGGGPQRGGMPPQQYYGGPPEYQQQGSGSQPRGGVPQQRRGGHLGSGRGFEPSGGPSRSPYAPDLHQAPRAPHQARVTSQQAQPVPYAKPTEMHEGSSSSTMVPQTSPSQVAQQFQRLSVQQEGPSSLAIQPVPASSKSMRFPIRPGKGSIGTRCVVKANHFFAELPDKDLHQYDVSITPEVTSRGVNRAVMAHLVKLYKESHLGKRLPAYDGRKSLYTAGPLPFNSKEFKITLVDEDDGSGSARREREFKVVIKLATRIDLHHLEMFLQGRVAEAPQEALQVLDIVLRELPTKR